MGRRQLGKVKKKPSDYPQFAFRTSEANQARINRMVDAVQRAYHKSKHPDEPYWTKGDILVEALDIGLNALSKRPKPARSD